MTSAATLSHQLQYYRARAGEYDDWWWRTGRYDRGPEANARWFSEIKALEDELERFAPRGAVLELACGTGLWTRHLVRYADSVTAVDGAPEVLERNRDRIEQLRPVPGPTAPADPAPTAPADPAPTELAESAPTAPAPAELAPVSYVQADLFEWEPPAAAFDACVFAFWLSHVPEDRFERFWAMVGRALTPGGRVLVIDSARSARSKARDHVMPDEDASLERRRLDDGREYEVVKRYYEPSALQTRLAALGWDCSAGDTGEFFIYATARRFDS